MLLSVDQHLVDLLRVDEDDINQKLFMSILDAARNKIDKTGLGEWRTVTQPTTDVVRECLFVTERYIDESFKILSRVTVLEHDQSSLTATAIHLCENAIQSLICNVDFRK